VYNRMRWARGGPNAGNTIGEREKKKNQPPASRQKAISYVRERGEKGKGAIARTIDLNNVAGITPPATQERRVQVI